MFRIEVCHYTQEGAGIGWGPALMPSIGTNLTPERASTFETPEVAFETAAKLGKLQPTARYRVVDAGSGVVIWETGHDLEDEANAWPRARFLNGAPVGVWPQMVGRTVRVEGPSRPDDLDAHSIAARLLNVARLPSSAFAAELRPDPPVASDSISPKYRGNPELFAADLARYKTETAALADEASVDATREFLSQIIASQEEFVGGMTVLAADTRRLADSDLVLHGPIAAIVRALAASTEESLYAAQETLTNLRELAKRLSG